VPTEYDELFSARRPSPEALAELDQVRARFSEAARPYLSSPLPWLAWGVALAAAALLTPSLVRHAGPSGVLLLWSGAILAAGLVEVATFWRRRSTRSLLAAWALRAQGNLSLVGLALTAALVWRDAFALLPGLWLLLLGHSFYILGGLSLPALARYGLAYQLGGALALFAGSAGLRVFAVTALLANWGLGLAVLLRRRASR
jgi:hypothetical protein